MNALDLLKLPLHAAQVATGAKSFEKNAVLGSRRLNERGLHVARVRAAASMADRRRRSLAARVDADHRERFARDGFVAVPDFLSPETFAAVERELEEPFDRYDMKQGSTVTRRAMIDDADLRDRPGLRAARDDRRFLDLVRYVASHDGQPLVTLQVVLADASGTAKAADPQTMLHADTFHATAKAWLFLRDVRPDDGPFLYVPGSHVVTPERMEWEREISCDARAQSTVYARRGSLRVPAGDLAAMGYDEPQAMTVRANTLVVADTHGFHARSASPRRTTRMEIYASLRRNPFLPWTGLHPASLPGVSGRTNRTVNEGLALMKRVGLRGNPWRARGPGPADEWPADLLPG